MFESPESVLEFWFGKLKPKDWFVKSEALDREIRDRFLDLHLALSSSVPEAWRETPDARLALVIALDQFPRNLFRDSPHAFATDGLALAEARVAVATGADKQIDADRRAFFYMPFEHSEAIEDQARAVSLFSALGNEMYLDYAQRHHAVIEKYGRFPHRNRTLGRTSTTEEEAYLAEPGAGF